MKTPSSPSLRPLHSDEFLPPISRWTTGAGVMLMTLVGTAIALACFLRYTVTVKAPATVRPEGDIRVVQAEMEGTVAHIAVQVNQDVQPGEVIASLDPVRLDLQQQQLDSTIQHTQTQLAQLDAQIRLTEQQIVSERRSLDRQIGMAEAEVTLNQQTYAEQQQTRQADLAEAEAALAFAEREMQRYQQLANTGAISQLQLEEKQAAVQTAMAQVARASAALNPSAAGVAIAQERLAQEQSNQQTQLVILERDLRSLIQQRVELQTQYTQSQTARQQLEAERSQSVIRATTAGTILRLNLRNVNQVVESGDTIAEIIPQDQGLVLKAMVFPQDIRKIAPGQLTQVRLHACPYPDYGTLQGEVVAISPDAIPLSTTPENSSVSTQGTARFFEVTIKPQNPVLRNGNRHCQLQPGMEADVTIVSSHETMIQFILRKVRLVTGV